MVLCSFKLLVINKLPHILFLLYEIVFKADGVRGKQ